MYAYINIKQKLKSKCSNLNEKRKPASLKGIHFLGSECVTVLESRHFQLSAAQIPMLFNLRKMGGEVPALQSISMKCVCMCMVVDTCMTEIYSVTFIQKT